MDGEAECRVSSCFISERCCRTGVQVQEFNYENTFGMDMLHQVRAASHLFERAEGFVA